jgi:hypothetical protein
MKIVFAALGALAWFLTGTAASAQNCNRDCLKQHLDTYLAAVTRHKPEAGKLWVGFRQTENSVVIPEGQGAWQAVTALGSVQRRYLDPVQSQAGYFGTVFLGDEEAVVAIRIKVQWNQVLPANYR